MIAGLGVLVAAAALSASLILLLRPLFLRYTLARPNARSSHREPTPQGGGIAVIAAALSISTGPFLLFGEVLPRDLLLIFAATVLLAIVGGIDDVLPIPVAPRLLLQTLAVALVIASLPSNLGIIPFLPQWAERFLLLIGGLWFINVVNFMDGVDWITVTQTLTTGFGIILISIMGGLPVYVIVLAIALCGATLGFAPFNKPVARLFLGDVGSLPLGLLLGWLLLMVALQGYLAAAVLLPMYYLADTTITLARRLLNGETIWHAHRQHFYQRAFDRRFTAFQIAGRILATNLTLTALAVATVLVPHIFVIASALTLGVAVVAALLVSFSRARQ